MCPPRAGGTAAGTAAATHGADDTHLVVADALILIASLDGIEKNIAPTLF